MGEETPQKDVQNSAGHSKGLPVRAARGNNPRKSQGKQRPAILVPLDGSPLAELILPYAGSLARSFSATLTLLRVVPMQGMIAPMFGTVPSGAVLQEIWDAELASAKEYLDQVAERLRKERCSVDTRFARRVDPAEEIMRFPELQTNVMMIAMTTHGRSGLGRLLFGSIAERVLRASPVPLLLVRPVVAKAVAELSNMPEYRAILVPLDGSPFAEQALAAAQTVAGATGASITLISVASAAQQGAESAPGPGVEGAALEPSERHALSIAGVDVAQTPVEDESLAPSDLPSDSSLEREARRLTDYLEEVAARLRATGLVVNTHVASGDPADEVVTFGEQLGAPPSPSRKVLIVMATHARSRLQSLWPGSVALTVMQMTELPVLLVRAQEPDE